MQESQNKQQGNQTGNQNGGLSWNEPAKKQNTPPVVTTTPTHTPKKNTSTPADQKNNVATVVGVLAAAVLVGSVGAWALSAMKDKDTVATTETATTTSKTSSSTGVLTATNTTPTIPAVVTENTALSIPSPQSAGLQVMVANAGATQPTWVVVYENNNGALGNALGAGLFFGGNQSGAIELLRGTIAGRTYFVGQSVDNGDKTFSLQSDKPVTDTSGAPIVLQFQSN